MRHGSKGAGLGHVWADQWTSGGALRVPPPATPPLPTAPTLLTNPHAQAVVYLTFEYKLKEGLSGLYRSTYTLAGSTTPQYLAATQLEANSARTAFPCFDEPAMKVGGRAGGWVGVGWLVLAGRAVCGSWASERAGARAACKRARPCPHTHPLTTHACRLCSTWR